MTGGSGDEHDDCEEAHSQGVSLDLGPLAGQGTSGKVFGLLNSIDGGRYVVKKVPLKRASDGEAALLEEVRLHRLVSAGCTSIVRYAFSNMAGSVLLVCMEACDFPLWSALTEPRDGCHLAVGSLAASRSPEELQDLKAQRSAITTELCAAVRHCHSLRVLHRDINPWNVFLARRDGAGPPFAAKLGDYGLAARLPEGVEELHGTEVECPAVALDESALGSLYSAPELGKRYGFAADVFSAGMTLLALWSAAACSDQEVLTALTEDTKKAADSAASDPARPADAQDPSSRFSTINSMLRAKPSARPSAEEVCAGFGRACDSVPTKSSEQTDVEGTFRLFLPGSTLVSWKQLSKVISCCGLSSEMLVALEAVWGRDVDGVLDYTLFLDWLFQQDTGAFAAVA